jgi:hypothetical protein
MVRGGVLAAVAALVALPGCSLVLDFSEPVSDAAPAAIDATGACGDDEPNDTQDVATALAAGDLESALCPASDLDYYAFDVETDGSDVVITLTFDGEAHDLRLTLLDAAGTELTVSAGATGEERIERTAAQLNTLTAGGYAILVGADDDGGDAPYTLSLTVTAP